MIASSADIYESGILLFRIILKIGPITFSGVAPDVFLRGAESTLATTSKPRCRHRLQSI